MFILVFSGERDGVSKQRGKILVQSLCECPEEMGRTACGSLNVLHSQFLSVLSVFKSLKFKGRMREFSLGLIVNPLYSSR